MNVTRNILPVLAGVVGGMILIFVGELAIHALYPSMDNVAGLETGMASIPATAFILIILNYAACSFLAGIISTMVSRRVANLPALVVGIVLSIAGIYNALNVPQPAWVSVTSVLMFLPFAYLGYFVARRKDM